MDFHGDCINETHQTKAAADLRRMLPADDENIIRIHGFSDDQFTQWAPLKKKFQTDQTHTAETLMTAFAFRAGRGKTYLPPQGIQETK
ncbi:MAG: hypothetical protein WCS94_04445 [Verrucomicrobiota bacterium]